MIDRATATALGCIALIAGCAPPEARPEAMPQVHASGLRFVDVSAESGIDRVTVSGHPTRKTAIPESLGQGAAAIDFDRDGLLDVFVVNGDMFEDQPPDREARSTLYRNLGGMRFADVGERAGICFRAWGHGVSRVDFDGDGWDDLYVTIYRGRNRFFRNKGDGSFEDLSDRWGGADPGPSTGAAFFDADGDGDLDLYVGNYVHYDPDDPPNGGKPCEWRGLAVLCGPHGTRAADDAFYENREGRLSAANSSFGFDRVDAAYALGVVAADLDDDLDIDLYVANDSVPNYFFENLGGGRFEERGARAGVDRNEDGRAQAGMGVDVGDVDNDGRLDLFVTNFSHDSNTLYRGREIPGGATTFEDATYSMKLGMSSYRYLSWGVRLLDLDFDGWQDIVVVSGHVYPQVDQTPIGTSYRQRNQIFRNLGRESSGVRFEEFEAEPDDAFAVERPSRGLMAADLDNDGDLDFVVTELDMRPTVIRNDSTPSGRWAGFRIVRGDLPIDPVGASLTVTDESGIVRRRSVIAGGSYLSTGDPRLHVGVGSAEGPLQVELRMPDGGRHRFADLGLDRYWRLDLASGSARAD